MQAEINVPAKLIAGASLSHKPTWLVFGFFFFTSLRINLAHYHGQGSSPQGPQPRCLGDAGGALQGGSGQGRAVLKLPPQHPPFSTDIHLPSAL